MLEWDALLQLQQLAATAGGATATGQQQQQPQGPQEATATHQPALPRDEDPDGDEVYERAGKVGWSDY